MGLKYKNGNIWGNKNSEYENISRETLENYRKFMEDVSFNRAIEEVLKFTSYLNKYVDSSSPWDLAKRNDPKLDSVLYTLHDGLILTAYMLYPFMPNKMGKVFEVFCIDNLPKDINPYTFKEYRVKEKIILFPKR